MFLYFILFKIFFGGVEVAGGGNQRGEVTLLFQILSVSVLVPKLLAFRSKLLAEYNERFPTLISGDKKSSRPSRP